MSSDFPEVRQLLKALIPKIESCTQQLNAQAIGNSIYGCKNMNSNYVEVRQLLKLRIPMIELSTESLIAQHVGNIVYGLRNMRDDCSEVRELIQAVTPKIIETCDIDTGINDEVFEPQRVSNCLFGLRAHQNLPKPLIQYIENMLPNALCTIDKIIQETNRRLIRFY